MSEAETPERIAPEGAESWFYAPRHPLIKTPTPFEIAHVPLGELSSTGVRATVYSGLTFDPQPADELASGTLHIFQDGLLFLPFGPARSELIEFLEDGGETIIDMAIGDLVNGFPVAMVLTHHIKAADERRRELARWEHPELFWAGYVDLIEAAHGRSPGGTNLVQLGYLAIVLEDQDGLQRRYSIQLDDQNMARLLFKQRVDAEMRYFRRLAEADISGFHERARKALAALGLEVTEERIDEEAIFAAARRMIEEGWEEQIEQLTLSQLVETLQSVFAATSEEAQARYGDQLTREKLRLIEAYFDVYREACQRVPVFAHLFELLEAGVSGTKPSDWSPPWNPADFRFNFAPGEYPVTNV